MIERNIGCDDAEDGCDDPEDGYDNFQFWLR
jgi:hypothetical protein